MDVFIVAFVAVVAYRSSFKLLQMKIPELNQNDLLAIGFLGIILVCKSGTKPYFVVYK